MPRVANSIKNAKVSFAINLSTMVMGFFARKIFLDHLGAKILGLNTLIGNLLNFLNLAELGIGSAIAFSLYRPLFNRDQDSINEIISVQGYMYRIVASIIAFCGLILMAFFPIIFEKSELPVYYAYVTFLVMLFCTLLGYFVSYKQNILEADQKQYIVIFCTYGIRLIKSLMQIVAVIYLVYPYFFWLLLELFFSVFSAWSINYSVKKEYPNLVVSVSQGRILIRKYSKIVTKIKQLLFHKLSGFAVYQSNPLIIYYFTSLTVVTIYGNYLLILTGVMMVINSTFSGINASIGNLLAEGDTQKIRNILWELLASRMWIASLLCFGVLELSTPFITLWIGKEYLLNTFAIYMLLIYQFIQMIRITENFLYGYGLFNDVWAGIAEALLHIGFAILGGYYWGVTGLLTGVVIAVFLIGMVWKPIFLFKWGFRDSVGAYFFIFAKNMLIIFSAGLVTHSCIYYIKVKPLLGFIPFLWYSIQVVTAYGCISLILFYMFSRGIRNFIHRFIKFI